MLVYEKKGHKCAICSEKRNCKALRLLPCRSIGASLPFTSILSDLNAFFKNCFKMENGKLVDLSPPVLYFFFSKSILFCFIPMQISHNLQGSMNWTQFL